MNRRLLRLLVGTLSTVFIASGGSAPMAHAQEVDPENNPNNPLKLVDIHFAGPANNVGSLTVKVVLRGVACDGAGFGSAFNYDNVPGGISPTTAAEIRNRALTALSPPPAGYVVEAFDVVEGPILRIRTSDKSKWFDVCVTGTPAMTYAPPLGVGEQPKIATDQVCRIASVNGITVTCVTKRKGIPMASRSTLAIVALLLVTSGALFFQRSQSLGTA